MIGLFFAIALFIPAAAADRFGWQIVLAFWGLLFVGSGLLKLLGLGF